MLQRIEKVRQNKVATARKEGQIADDDNDKEARQRSDDAKDAAKKLSDAVDTATKGELTKSINDAVDDLKNDRPNAAQGKQQQAAKTLEQMAKALDGQKDDDLALD